MIYYLAKIGSNFLTVRALLHKNVCFLMNWVLNLCAFLASKIAYRNSNLLPIINFCSYLIEKNMFVRTILPLPNYHNAITSTFAATDPKETHAYIPGHGTIGTYFQWIDKMNDLPKSWMEAMLLHDRGRGICLSFHKTNCQGTRNGSFTRRCK